MTTELSRTEQPQGENGIAKVDAGDNQFLANLLGQSINNFDGEPLQRMKLEMLATSKASHDKDDYRKASFLVKYLYAHPVEIVDGKSGEVIDAIRVVLINPQFESIEFVSSGVAQSIATIVKYKGLKPYTPPLPVRVIEGKTRNGFRIYSLAIADK